MRRLTLITALLAALAGAGVAAPSANAGCAFVVVWHDRAYLASGGPQDKRPQPGAPVQGALEPGCNDTGGAGERPTPVRATSIDGVTPEMALLVRNTVLVAYGYLPTVPTDETRGCNLGGPVRITGRTNVALGFIDVSVKHSTVRLHHLLGGSAQVFLDGGTRIDGLARDGHPYIGTGQRVQVDARFCKVPGSVGTKIVARRIVPAGPIVAPSTAEDILGDDWRGSPGVVSRTTGGHSLAVAIVIILAAGGIGAALVAHRRRSLPPGTG
jgi:hypothetical protein